MPRYFFHLVTPDFIIPDHTNGRDLEDASAARDCAVANIKAIMEGKPWRGLNPITSSVEVTDERGKLFLKLPLEQPHLQFRGLGPNCASFESQAGVSGIAGESGSHAIT